MATFARLLIAQETFTIVACLNLHTHSDKDMASKDLAWQTDRQPYGPHHPLPPLSSLAPLPHCRAPHKLPCKSAKVKAH